MHSTINAIIMFLLSLATLAGCATNLGRPTKAEVDQANQICTNQIMFDRAARVRNSFSRWLLCREKYYMPLEIRQFPGKEAQIREMYKKLFPLALAVDSGSSRVEAVYDQWDKMRSDLDMSYEVCLKRPDGSQKCAARQNAVLFMETKNGDIVPFK